MAGCSILQVLIPLALASRPTSKGNKDKNVFKNE
jgi:hypothetical protein